ncbi:MULTISPECIES: hypothetical protein [unclassified Crossiella]|uniref:hypothetical protein n=1 Tax=unclassified Crossiella TaxID=2620835 RepID=UPI002000232E|nr:MULTISPECIES: hypothetical protein [unclassified Crossiella]MCK2243644.1 hypothetical protein [Crossiella sp. S99.2]MCK2257502.1 hypothetical protein [Crossiella sp. S99.1]
MPTSSWRAPVLATAAALALLGAQAVYGAVRAEQVLPAGLAEAARERGWADIRVELNFPPEQFNTAFLAERGSLVGVRGTTVDLLGVTEAELREIAGLHWVRSVHERR